jgi:hypothetical protein
VSNAGTDRANLSVPAFRAPFIGYARATSGSDANILFVDDATRLVLRKEPDKTINIDGPPVSILTVTAF